jgi:Cu-Zn family superoxide dismutase
MKAYQLIAGSLLALTAAACTTPAPPEMDAGPNGGMAAASADVREPGGRIVARASAEQAGDSVRVRVEAAGLAPGAYGAHVHMTGRCDAPGFTTAGGHWNPTGQQHGKDNPQGMHKGDLPNLLVGANGQGSFEYTIPGAMLTGGMNPVLDADGAAVVIHASADDYRTDPSGNSGARVACGVLAGG